MSVRCCVGEKKVGGKLKCPVGKLSFHELSWNQCTSRFQQTGIHVCLLVVYNSRQK